MSTLLVSLGTSPAIVPEAFLLPGGGFASVHVLTTASVQEEVVRFVEDWFAGHAPAVALTITRVDGFEDFKSEDDHFLFEEVLYRWWLEVGTSLRLDSPVEAGFQPDGGESRQAGSLRARLSQAGGLLPHVCLAGGFKTMSSAMQKAAAVMGAAEVFHVLCDLPSGQQPKDAAEIEAARAGGHLHWIRLGPESGWPQFRLDRARDFPLVTEREEGAVRWVSSPDPGFRGHLREIVERSHHIAGAWERIGSLPFSALATLPGADLAWLGEAVDPIGDRDWVAALPKVELHCHLGGFATHGELLAEVRSAAENPSALPDVPPPEPPPEWPLTARPITLSGYMKLGDANGSALLRDPGCLRRQCELLYAHLQAQNVVYAEIRCSPANYAVPGRSPWTVLEEIKQTFDACMVGAAVPGDSTVPATVPVAGSDGIEAHAGSPHPRQFQAFDREAEYLQTWRDLPHRHQEGATAYVTFRLADSLPKERLADWRAEQVAFLSRHPKPWTESIWQDYRRHFPDRLEAWLDEAHGACWLRQPEIAAMVESALLHFDGQRYVLDAYVIMPNHAHVLVKPLPGHDLDSVLHSWKSFTATVINRKLGRTGQLWEHESFDHLVRSQAQLDRLRDYIVSNPRMAGLADGFVVGQGFGLVPEWEQASRVPPVSGHPSRMPDRPAASQRLAATVPSSQRLAATTVVNLIVIATRKETGDYRAAISRHLALAVSAAEHWTGDDQCRVVGVDLAGYEDITTRAHYFREEFTAIHRCGLALTVHAGENDDAEGIWRAVFDLNARRLGHALHLKDSPELMRSVADRGIGVEMCPYANLQIQGYPLDTAEAPDGYPLKRYLDRGIRVTVNTDNIGISAASLTDNLLLAARLCPGLTRMDLLRLQSHALQAAFLAPEQRDRLTAALSRLITQPVRGSKPPA